MPIPVAVQCDVLDKLDNFQTLDNFQKYLLKRQVPELPRLS